MLFVIDFDGTLARQDSVDAMLERFAVPEWKAVEQEWLAGGITAIECMTRQMRMVRADRNELEAFFRAIELDPSFSDFHRHVCDRAGVAIVSDGLDYPIQVAIQAAGFPAMPVFANRLHFVPGSLDISYPHQNRNCTAGNGVCKCAVATDLARPLGEGVVLIGDGKSDFCLAHRADAVFAKGSLRDYCIANRVPHHVFDTFADVLAVVKTWGSRPPSKLALVA